MLAAAAHSLWRAAPEIVLAVCVTNEDTMNFWGVFTPLEKLRKKTAGENTKRMRKKEDEEDYNEEEEEDEVAEEEYDEEQE